MTTDFARAVSEDQRLEILRALAQAADYSAPEHILRTGLATIGHHPSAAQLRAHLEWLDEVGLIALLGDQVRVARLTMAGQDVATGATTRSGVARPRP